MRLSRKYALSGFRETKLELRVVAGGHQQHLGGLVAGNGSGGVKLAVAICTHAAKCF